MIGINELYIETGLKGLSREINFEVKNYVSLFFRSE